MQERNNLTELALKNVGILTFSLLMIFAITLRWICDSPPASIVRVENAIKAYMGSSPQQAESPFEINDIFYFSLAVETMNNRYNHFLEPEVRINDTPKDYCINIYVIEEGVRRNGIDLLQTLGLCSTDCVSYSYKDRKNFIICGENAVARFVDRLPNAFNKERVGRTFWRWIITHELGHIAYNHSSLSGWSRRSTMDDKNIINWKIEDINNLESEADRFFLDTNDYLASHYSEFKEISDSKIVKELDFCLSLYVISELFRMSKEQGFPDSKGGSVQIDWPKSDAHPPTVIRAENLHHQIFLHSIQDEEDRVKLQGLLDIPLIKHTVRRTNQ